MAEEISAAEAGLSLFPAGAMIAGKYEVLKILGRGGSGTVYLVMDTHLRKNWAMKVIRKSDYPGGEAALYREMDMLKKLAHPYLPRIVDAFEDRDELFVIMDFIEGRTLDVVLMEEGPQEVRDVVRWGRSLTEVLTYLHRRDPPVIYLDMKPGNIMLRPDGEVMLVDLGVARECTSEGGPIEPCIGTPGYAAPEQLDPALRCDEKTDIYSVGVTLHQLLTGRTPSAQGLGLLPLRAVDSKLPLGLEIIIENCTKKIPEERYGSCEELGYDLKHYREMDVAYRRKERKKIMAFGLALVTGIAGMTLAAYGRSGLGRERERQYQRILMEADAIADGGEEQYLPSVTETYAVAADLIPSKEDAYLRILDYCAEKGKTGTGLKAVCSRIDSGSGGIDHCSAVLFRVAELYFGGNSLDDSFSGNYRKAARYFAMVDRKEIPEAVYYASLAEAMSQAGGKADWSHIGEMLRHFEEFNEGLPFGENRIRNRVMAAGVYTANRHAFLDVQVDAYGSAIRLLEAARKEVNELREDAAYGVVSQMDMPALERMELRILQNLGAAYAASAASGGGIEKCDRAMDCYENLLAKTCEEEKRAEILERMEAVQKSREYLEMEAARGQ